MSKWPFEKKRKSDAELKVIPKFKYMVEDRGPKARKKEEDATISEAGKLKLTIGDEIDVAPIAPSMVLKKASDKKAFFEESEDEEAESDIHKEDVSNPIPSAAVALTGGEISNASAGIYVGVVSNSTLESQEAADHSPTNINYKLNCDSYTSSPIGIFEFLDFESELVEFFGAVSLTGENPFQ